MPLTKEERDKRYGGSTKHVVSYSQFSQWNDCPFRWYLNYVKKHRFREPSIHLLFGTAMHEVIQAYIKALFEKSVKVGEALDLLKMLRLRMAVNYKLIQEEFPDIEDPVSKEDMIEFYNDGVEILIWLKKHRLEYFNTKTHELVGIEIPADRELVPGLKFVGDLDIVLKDKKSEKIKIIDIKTSTKSWNSYKKNSETTTMQLVIYKIFYADKYKISADNISVEYLVVKRKLKQKCEFPQKRVQRVVPASGKPTRNKTIYKLKSFVTTAYKDDAEYNEDGIFPKIPFPNNCRFCEYRDLPELCDKKI